MSRARQRKQKLRAQRQAERSANGQAPSPPPPLQPASVGTAAPTLFWFGRHKGRPIESVPTRYLTWAATNAENVSPDLRATIVAELKRRSDADPTITPAPPPPPAPGLPTSNGQPPSHVQPSPPVSHPARPALPPLLSRPMLNVREVAELLQVSVRTVWYWRDKGRLPPPFQLGKQVVRWRTMDVLNWIVEQNGEPEP
jgi:predicted DNA-binding transcriptional regulator AlpA